MLIFSRRAARAHDAQVPQCLGILGDLSRPAPKNDMGQ